MLHPAQNRLVRAVIWLWPLAIGSLAIAQDPVATGRDVLSAKSYPWYDSSKDAARPLLTPKPPAPPKANKAAPAALTRPGSFSGFGAVLQVLGWIALAALITAIIVLAARAFVGREVTETQARRVVQTLKQADKVEHLPVQVQADEGDFLATARRHYEAGNYSQAIIYLFSYQLLQLDHHQIIRLAKGKTNRQYLRETKRRPELRGLVEATMVAFEDVFFGKHALDRARFEACWNQLPAFQHQLQQQGAT
jgi:hypothetical protein